MKNKKKITRARYSKASPSSWPSVDQLRNAEKELEKSLPTIVRGDNATPIQKIKHLICAEFVKYANDTEISQRALAQALGVTESRVSEILHYHFDHFTIDRLLTLLIKIKPTVSLRVAG